MKTVQIYITILMALTMLNCSQKQLTAEIYETSAGGNKLKQIKAFVSGNNPAMIKLMPEETFQTITGFGGSFTEASASLLNKLSKENREKILEAYFLTLNLQLM